MASSWIVSCEHPKQIKINESRVKVNDLLFRKNIRWKSLRNDGGADRDRTDDLHNAIVALFQLSYGPIPKEGKELLNTLPSVNLLLGRERIDKQ